MRLLACKYHAHVAATVASSCPLSFSLSLKTGSNNSLIIQIPTSPAYPVSCPCLLAWPGLPVNYYYFSLEKPKRKNEMPKRMQSQSQLELKLKTKSIVLAALGQCVDAIESRQ